MFAIGDNATPNDGHRLPATAQVASQMAGHMAATLKALGGGTKVEATAPFRWKDHGSMVFIGDYRAMVDRSKSKDDGPRARLSGFVAWVVWRSYYVTLAMGWRNKASGGRGKERREETLTPDPHPRVLDAGHVLWPRRHQLLVDTVD